MLRRDGTPSVNKMLVYWGILTEARSLPILRIETSLKRSGEHVKSHSFLSLIIAAMSIAYGVGLIVGVEPGSTSDGTTLVEPVVVAKPSVEPVVAAKPVVPEPAKKVDTPKPPVAKAAPKVVPPPTKEAPVVSGLPTEPGMPPEDGKPIPNAPGYVLPEAPKSWLPSPARGAEDPLVTVIIASDFQCPVCKRVVKPVEALVKELGRDVRIEFKNHALESHPRAEDAAAAAMAAHRQGKFWEMHDQLFMNQRALAPGDLEAQAQKMGLDMAQWQKDFNDQGIRQQIRSNGKTAEALGARGTPGFFINGKKQVGWGSFFGFKGMVDRELKKAKELEKGGMKRADVIRQRVRENSENGEIFIQHYLNGKPFEGV